MNIPDQIPEEFWATIEKAIPQYPNYLPLFKNMGLIDLISFAWNYEEAALQLHPFFETSYNFSEDSLCEFSFWVVAKGKFFYRSLWDKCDTEMVSNMNSELRQVSDPGIYAAACEAYFNQTGNEIPQKDIDGFFSAK